MSDPVRTLRRGRQSLLSPHGNCSVSGQFGDLELLLPAQRGQLCGSVGSHPAHRGTGEPGPMSLLGPLRADLPDPARLHLQGPGTDLPPPCPTGSCHSFVEKKDKGICHPSVGSAPGNGGHRARGGHYHSPGSPGGTLGAPQAGVADPGTPAAKQGLSGGKDRPGTANPPGRPWPVSH